MVSTLTSLLASASIDDHEEALQTANTALKSLPQDLDALHTRVVALIKLDRFSEALRALDDGGDALATRCALEKAYTLYKLGQLEEAQKIASDAQGARGLTHVAAQAAYRSEKFEDTAKLYRELAVGHATIDGEENDIRINSVATDAQLQSSGRGDLVERSRKKPGREDLEAFETTYNAACGYIARGELNAASTLLKRARDLCEALDWASEEEMKAELLPIMVQQAYVFTRLGKVDEARALQDSINSEDVIEVPTRIIAQNNAIIARSDDNPYITQRSIDSVPTPGKSDRLFEYQSSLLYRNRKTADLRAYKAAGVVRSTNRLLTQDASTLSDINAISALNAIARLGNGKTKASIDKLRPILEAQPSDVGLILVLTQLYILSNNPGAATTMLETLFTNLEKSDSHSDKLVRFSPGLVSIIVSLYKLQGRTTSLRAELSRAAAFWQQQSVPSTSLCRAAGLALVNSYQSDDLEIASGIFKRMRQQDPSDAIAKAGYIAATVTTNYSAVETDLQSLTPIKSLTNDIDAEALEDAGIAILPVTNQVVTKKRTSPTDIEKPKKKRMGKLPKDYVESRQPDPERWLPLKDRSSYRPKGKKGKKKALDSTQGGVVKDEDMADVAPASTVLKPQATSGKAKKKKGKK